MDSGWVVLIVRVVFLAPLILLLYLSQRFWFARGWELAGRARQPLWKGLLRAFLVLSFAAVALSFAGWVLRVGPRHSSSRALAGLWLSSSFLAYFGVKVVTGIEWLWLRATRRKTEVAPPAASLASSHDPPDPSRRYFFQRASYVAGAVPFLGALYGFAVGRLRYRLERVEIPIGGLPAALDGLRIVQLSDIHAGAYMPREQLRRAVEMANELAADLAVVTGDFITGSSDPLDECVQELARLRVPLGVWGCNGNHEIYSDAEDYAAELFRQAGMRILRRENAELVWQGRPFNLIGVDYQRSRTPGGRRLPMLARVEPLVRRDVPNILLCHNPNGFPRAAEMGIELTLAGHTHGGQVQVEILDRRWSPARFITDFVAGLYQRPLGSAVPPAQADGSPMTSGRSALASSIQPPTSAFLYVNRGLGTVGAPVRIGVPPEITLLTLRRGEPC